MSELNQTERNSAEARGEEPTGGFAALVPELDVSNVKQSLKFWCDLLGFRIAYQREEAGFAYLERQGAQVMLCQVNGEWVTGLLERPFGRGINFQIGVDDIKPMLESIAEAGWPLFRAPQDTWYAVGANLENGSREFLVQDPDGYLLRFSQSLGHRTKG